MVGKLLSIVPKDRPSIEKILEEPFVRKYLGVLDIKKMDQRVKHKVRYERVKLDPTSYKLLILMGEDAVVEDQIKPWNGRSRSKSGSRSKSKRSEGKIKEKSISEKSKGSGQFFAKRSKKN